jgi:hypothetical protein
MVRTASSLAVVIDVLPSLLSEPVVDPLEGKDELMTYALVATSTSASSLERVIPVTLRKDVRWLVIMRVPPDPDISGSGYTGSQRPKFPVVAQLRTLRDLALVRR